MLKGSNVNRLVIIELVGPLVDDRGAVIRTLATVVAAAGVTLRPGAVDQVAGASGAWAIATLVEGHGRDDLVPRVGDLFAEVVSGWRRQGEGVVAAAGAVTAWQRLLSTGVRVGVVSALPTDVTSRFAEHAGLSGVAERCIDNADGARGLPRPDAIRDAIMNAGVTPADVTVIGCSPGVLLAAAGARVADIVLIGPKSDTLPATRYAESIGEALSALSG